MLLCCALAAAQTPSLEDVSVAAVAEPSECRAGDAVVYRVRVTIRNNVTEKIEPWPPAFRGFDVAGGTNARQPVGADRTRFEWQYQLRPRQEGELTIGPFSLNYLDRGDGRRKQVRGNPVTVRVRAAEALPDIREARPPVVLPDLLARYQRAALWLGLFCAAVLCGSSVQHLLSRRRPRPTPVSPAPPSPRDVALAALAALEADDLPARGEIDAYHVRLSRLVRAFLSARYTCRAEESTTSEIADTLTSRGASADLVVSCRQLLVGCDLEKFAGFTPGLDDMRGLLARARLFVEASCAEGRP